MVCSIGRSVPEFAQALRAGRCGIKRLTSAPVSGHARFAALIEEFDFLKHLESLDWADREMRDRARRAVHRTPLAVQMSTAAALQAWAAAKNLRESAPPRERIGLIVAGSAAEFGYRYQVYQRYREDPFHIPPSYALQHNGSFQLGVISEVLATVGEGYLVAAGSASGNVGIINGYRMVSSGAVDVCLVVGALADLSPIEFQSYQNLGAMAGGSGETVTCRPFDSRRGGFIYGQGTGCLLLESSDSVEKRQATPLAEIAGFGFKLDGNRSADPRVESEEWVMKRAVEAGGISPHEVAYLNSHGSSSVLGDAAEVEAVRRAFGPDAERLWINATKALTGHCLDAAGVIEAVATVIQMKEGFLHPNPTLDDPLDPGLRFVGKTAREEKIQYALSNSFGFGGVNTSVLFRNVN